MTDQDTRFRFAIRQSKGTDGGRQRGNRAGKPTTLALVSMPFVSCRSPSLQLGTLAPIAVAAGYPTRTFHFMLDFAALMGVDNYEVLCDFGRQPIGDWLFSVEAFREET